MRLVRVIGPICLWAIGLFCFVPLLGNQFSGDDWHFFALFRHIDSTVDLVTTDIAASYIYRPFGLLFSAATFAIFGLNESLHFALNVGLHMWACIAAARLVIALGASKQVGLWLAVFTFVCPLLAATPSWTANRFDLIAAIAILESLRACVRFRSTQEARYGWWTLVWIIIAVGSKEIGFVAALGAVALLLTAATIQVKWIATIFALVLVGISVRYAVLGTLVQDWLSSNEHAAPVAGVIAQLRALYFALHRDFVGPLILGLVVLIGVVRWQRAQAAVLTALSRSSIPSNHRHVLDVLIFFGLFIVALVLQSAVAGMIFGGRPEAAAGANLRYFYLPILLLGVAVSVAIGARAAYVSSPFLATFALVVFAWFAWVVHRDSTSVVASAPKERAQLQRAVADFKREASQVLKIGEPCLISGQTWELARRDSAVDLAIKAHLPRDHAAVNCVLMTDPPQYISLTRVFPCNESQFGGVIRSEIGRGPLLRSGTCSFILAIRR